MAWQNISGNGRVSTDTGDCPYVLKTKKMTLQEKEIEVGNEIARSMHGNPDYRGHIGGMDQVFFVFEGKEYSIEVSAFWESLNHFDYVCVGIGHDYKNSQICIEF